MQSSNETTTTSRARKGREQMSNDKIDLTDFNELLSMQTAPAVQTDTTEPAPTPQEISKQKTIMKIYRKYQQREYERQKNRNEFPDDYFFSALAEILLDD